MMFKSFKILSKYEREARSFAHYQNEDRRARKVLEYIVWLNTELED